MSRRQRRSSTPLQRLQRRLRLRRADRQIQRRRRWRRARRRYRKMKEGLPRPFDTWSENRDRKKMRRYRRRVRGRRTPRWQRRWYRLQAKAKKTLRRPRHGRRTRYKPPRLVTRASIGAAMALVAGLLPLLPLLGFNLFHYWRYVVGMNGSWDTYAAFGEGYMPFRVANLALAYLLAALPVKVLGGLAFGLVVRRPNVTRGVAWSLLLLLVLWFGVPPRLGLPRFFGGAALPLLGTAFTDVLLLGLFLGVGGGWARHRRKRASALRRAQRVKAQPA